eukprot:6181026-Prymnesium_polylepis.1
MSYLECGDKAVRKVIRHLLYTLFSHTPDLTTTLTYTLLMPTTYIAAGRASDLLKPAFCIYAPPHAARRERHAIVISCNTRSAFQPFMATALSVRQNANAHSARAPRPSRGAP